MRYLLIGLAVLLAAVSSQPAHAHTLIADDSKTKGAILHLTPDDDPIAGQPSTLFFDVQNTATDTDAVVTLTVKKDGEQAEVQAKLDGSLATFDYTFPSQGVYSLVFSVPSSDRTYTFTVDWRVSRGVVASALDTPRHTWAEMALLASGVGLALLVVTMLGRWRYIWRQSTF